MPSSNDYARAGCALLCLIVGVAVLLGLLIFALITLPSFWMWTAIITLGSVILIGLIAIGFIRIGERW